MKKTVKSTSLKPKTEPTAEVWELRLYIAGQSPTSLVAVAHLKRLCHEHLEGRYRLKVIDLLEKPHLARDDQIVAVPTLVRQLPPPIKKIIGDLSNTKRLLVALDIGSAS